MPLNRNQARCDLEAHPRIQYVAFTPLLRLHQPLLTLQHLGLRVCAFEILLVPVQRCHFVVRAGERPVVFQVASEFVSVRYQFLV